MGDSFTIMEPYLRKREVLEDTLKALRDQKVSLLSTSTMFYPTIFTIELKQRYIDTRKKLTKWDLELHWPHYRTCQPNDTYSIHINIELYVQGSSIYFFYFIIF